MCTQPPTDNVLKFDYIHTKWPMIHQISHVVQQIVIFGEILMPSKYKRQLLSVAHTSNFALSRLILGNYLPTLHQFGRYWDQKTFGKIIQWQILITLDRIHHAAKGKVFSCCTITFGKGVMRYISLSGNISIPILDMHAAYVWSQKSYCIYGMYH